MHIGDLFENRGIELVSMSNDTVTFRSAQKFHPGGRVSFELDGQTVKLLVEEVSPDGDGNLFSGRAVVGKEILEGHFPQMHSHQQKRRAPRVLHRMKIVSEKLPSFQALSLDFSPLGLRIRLDGAIEENQTIPLLIDFDWPGQEALNTSARVVWCRRDQGQYLAGLEFVDVDELTAKLMEAFYQEMVSGEVGEVAKAVAHKHRLESATSEINETAEEEPARTRLNIRGHLESYSVSGDSVRLILMEEGGPIHVDFNELYFLRDHRGVAGLDVTHTWKLLSSRELYEANAHRPRRLLGPTPALSHIQFVNRIGLVVLEIVARES